LWSIASERSTLRININYDPAARESGGMDDRDLKYADLSDENVNTGL